MFRFNSVLLILALFGLAAPVDRRPGCPSRRCGRRTPLSGAITEQVAKLQEAFNAGQVERVTALFLPTAELIDERGTTHSGREALAELFGAFFAEFPGAKMQLDLESVRVITPQLATGDLVRAITTPQAGARAISRSAMTFVLHEGAWLIATGRDVAADAELSPHQQLEPLEWIIGDWVDEGTDSLIQIHAEWSKDESYILMDYLITREGEVQLSSQQRLGWDPLYEQIRSWVFDADGGFGGGLWTRVGDLWVLKSSAVLPDGATGSATFIIEPDGKDRFVMRGLDRIIGDAVEPDVEMTIVRKPPQSN